MFNPIPRLDSPQVEIFDPSVLEQEEAENRTAFFDECIANNPKLTDAHRQAIRDAMENGKNRSWSSYDGFEVKLQKIDLVGENMITITFEFDIGDRGLSVSEIIPV